MKNKFISAFLKGASKEEVCARMQINLKDFNRLFAAVLPSYAIPDNRICYIRTIEEMLFEAIHREILDPTPANKHLTSELSNSYCKIKL